MATRAAWTPPAHRQGEHGMAMMGLMVIMVTAATVALVAAMESRSANELRRALSTDGDLLRAREAVMAYYLTDPDGGFPCPDTSSPADGIADTGCTGATSGALPYLTLGTTRDAARDYWGRALTYAVHASYNGTTTGLQVRRGTDATAAFAGATAVENQAQAGVSVFPFVLVSHGPAGPILGDSGGSVAEDENADGDTDFLIAPAAPEAPTANRFDDRLTWPNIKDSS